MLFNPKNFTFSHSLFSINKGDIRLSFDLSETVEDIVLSPPLSSGQIATIDDLSHSLLDDLQGGDPSNDEFYHLDLSLYNVVMGLSSNYVPYTGADKDVNIGDNTFKSGKLIGVKGDYSVNCDSGFLFGESRLSGIIRNGSDTECGYGCLSGGYAAAGIISALGYGSTAVGYAAVNGVISSTGFGSVAFGSSYEGSITAIDRGAVCFGYAYLGHIIASGRGATAFGYTYNNGNISATGNGSVVSGHAYNGGTIEASGTGSYSSGYSVNNGLVSASGWGSFAYGYTDGNLIDDIIASANNAAQFGPGTNAITDNLQVGTGLSLYGKPSNPPTLRNGMLWQDGSNIYARINGVSKQLDNPDLSGYTPYLGATTDVDLGVHNITAANLDIAGWNAKWDYDEDTIKGVKVDNASNADTVNNLNVETSVPLGALFTDTTYEAGDGISLSGTTINNTDKGSDVDLSGLVPYIGADKDVDLGENTLKSGTIVGVRGKYTAHTGAGLLFGTAVGLWTNDASEIICGNESGASYCGGLAGGSVEENSFIESSGSGSFAEGCATTGSTITATGDGSFTQGQADNFGEISSTGLGSFAQGRAAIGVLSSTGVGSFAQGSAIDGGLSSTAVGSFAQGSAIDGGLNSTGTGSFAQGFADVYSITSSADGSFAQGYATWGDTDITASAQNAVQFGPGTNAIADNLQVGTGLSLYGKPSTPPTLRNGMLWQDGTALYIRLNDTTYTVNLTEVI